MSEVDRLGRRTESGVVRYDGDGTIHYVGPTVQHQAGYSESALLGSHVRTLFPSSEWDTSLASMLEAREPGMDVFEAETQLRHLEGGTIPVRVQSNTIGTDDFMLVIQDLTEQKRKERYLQFMRTVNEHILTAEDEATLLRNIVDTVAQRPVYGCTAIALLDRRFEVDEIYGIMESWCQMDWEAVYTPEYIDAVLDAGDMVIDDVTEGQFRQHTEEKGKHGAIGLALSHRGNDYGVMTMHLPGKGTDLSSEERDLLRELSDNVSTGIYNLRTESELRNSRKQLAVLDRVLRHNLRNSMSVVTGYAEALEAALTGEHGAHANQIRTTAHDLLETTDKEREIVDLILESPQPREIDLADVVEYCVENCRRSHSEVDLTASGPDSAVAIAIPQIASAVEELIENAVVHSDPDTPQIDVELTSSTDLVELSVRDEGPGIPEGDRTVLSEDYEIESLTHGSGLGLWLVDWVVKRSNGTVEFDQPEDRGHTVTMRLPAA